LITWRNNTGVIHTGKLVHFAPQNGIYVFFRFDDNKKIMVILNKNTAETELDLVRFKELIQNNTKGKELFSAQVFSLENKLKIPAKSPMILELE
jgi:hypothetical protein